ncbi:hypothetical protein E2C01_007149 [Portunus trituberculatus]|uniref:Uncharacterized protein n=1 Tax=Portunus trituberculatus TaxID=210409 RepID=A0A5B7D057_PORTR|nr:hypothetical protein [Portunus trituberculatus]
MHADQGAAHHLGTHHTQPTACPVCASYHDIKCLDIPYSVTGVDESAVLRLQREGFNEVSPARLLECGELVSLPGLVTCRVIETRKEISNEATTGRSGRRRPSPT